ncbi:hypothetical protein [Microbacterium sp. NIBRBAC000506063]|uniref:hypothetical protein n=1 Tax=Microbacterium sp. NIBRBAC000506063 TaxID=2734618 RepID=UPI001CB70DC0|nr:hypothetical protein [Microbacterium sp. NIBRBAC000506063]
MSTRTDRARAAGSSPCFVRPPRGGADGIRGHHPRGVTGIEVTFSTPTHPRSSASSSPATATAPTSAPARSRRRHRPSRRRMPEPSSS